MTMNVWFILQDVHVWGWFVCLVCACGCSMYYGYRVVEDHVMTFPRGVRSRLARMVFLYIFSEGRETRVDLAR